MSELPEWSDFLVVTAGSGAAILGASFIVATLPRSLEDRRVGIHGFISPTVMHLGSLIAASAILAMPGLGRLGVLLTMGGMAVVGMAYAAIAMGRIWARRLDLDDRFWYALGPIAAYAALGSGAVLIWLRHIAGPDMVMGSLVALLVLGMRNAWDMASFFIMRDPAASPE